MTPDSNSDDDLDVGAEANVEGAIPLKNFASRSRKSFDNEHEDEHTDSDEDEHILDNEARTRRTSVQSFELYTPEEEHAVLRKLDRRLVLFVALLYMLSFLDRSNIGNAEIAGLKQDLNIDDSQYKWLLRGFYITYILFEWMTLLYRVLPPHAYISLCVATWGLFASFQALSINFGSMLFLRLVLGISEAAFGPGVPFYFSFFFKRNELAYRTGLFISAAPLASSFASSLAYAIVRWGSKTGVQSWRLLFLIEGFPSVVVAVWAWYWIPDSPATARWLKPRERKIAALRMRSKTVQDQTKHYGGRSRKRLDWREIAKTLSEPRSYLTAAIFFSCNVAFSSMPVFEPIIVNTIGYSRVAAQGLSALPHLFAFVFVIVIAMLSDRFQTRSLPLVCVALMAMSGYVGLASAAELNLPSVVRYLCLFPITGGFFSAVTLTITWTLDNQQSGEGKGTGMALLNYIGQLGPFVGTALYWNADAPNFTISHTICAVFMLLIAVLTLALRLLLIKANMTPSPTTSAVLYSRVGLEEDEPSGITGSAQESRFTFML